MAVLAIATPVPAASAGEPPKLALLQVHFQNDNEGLEPTSDAERARLQRTGEEFSQQLAASGRFAVLPLPDDMRAQIAAGQAIGECGGCELDYGRKLGADIVAWIRVQKVSNLILNMNVYMADVGPGECCSCAASICAATPTRAGRAACAIWSRTRCSPPMSVRRASKASAWRRATPRRIDIRHHSADRLSQGRWNSGGSPRVLGSVSYSLLSASSAMDLYRTGLAAMAVATCFVSVMFVYALNAPTRPAVPAWKTRVVEVDEAAWAKRWAKPGGSHAVTFMHPVSLVNARR